MLKTSLSAKDSKPGTPFVMQVTKDVKGPKNQVLIPAGAKLTGRVTKAVPWSKESKDSALSLVAERAEWKNGAADLRAFLVGELHVLNSALGGGAGSLAQISPESVNGPPASSSPEGPSGDLPVDSSVKLRLAAEPEVVTEVYSAAHCVQMDAGSTFALKTMATQ
jgi:hypothetical protein